MIGVLRLRLGIVGMGRVWIHDGQEKRGRFGRCLEGLRSRESKSCATVGCFDIGPLFLELLCQDLL